MRIDGWNDVKCEYLGDRPNGFICSYSLRDTATTLATATSKSATATPHVLVIGGYFQGMESWTPFNFTPPTYNAIPLSEQWGSRAAGVGEQLYSCGSYRASDWRKCFTTVLGQTTNWTPAPDLQVGRWDHTLTAVGDKLVVTGGHNSGKLNSVEILNPGSSSWTDPGWSLSEPVYDHCAVADSNSSLVIIGGVTNSGRDTNSVRRYDLNTKSSTNMTSLPEALYGTACVIYKNKITVSGGRYINSGSTGKVWQLDGSQWVQLPSMKTKRDAHAMAVVGDEMFVFGGWGADQVVEKFDGTSWSIQEKGLQGRFMKGGSVVVN